MILYLLIASSAYEMGESAGRIFFVLLVIAVIVTLSRGKQLAPSGFGKMPLLGVGITVAGIALLLGGLYYLTPRKENAPVPASPHVEAQQPVKPAGDPELDQLMAQAQQQFKELSDERQKLDPKDAQAVKLFNQKASAYKDLTAKIAERQKKLSTKGSD